MWNLEVEDILEERDQWLPILEEQKLEDSTLLDDSWKKIDTKVMGTIWLSLKNSILLNASIKDTTYKL